MTSDDPRDALAGFGAATAHWFRSAFVQPTPAQVGAWGSVADTLVVAPTGSGKTLAAFLQAIDRLTREPLPTDRLRRTRVLYVSPLKALAVDVERNLRSPLTGIRREAALLGAELPEVRVAIRTGDTPTDERRRQARTPPDILITTPESLFLLLTSQARETLASVDTVIVDEVHAVAGTKRGAHLAVSLARLDALIIASGGAVPRRIGLSATVRPPEEVARFLAGGQRPVTIVAPASTKVIDVSVEVPVDDMANLREGSASEDGAPATAGDPGSLWPHVERRVVDLIAEHRSTIVFANSRRLAERLTAKLNEEWVARTGDESAVLARAHHGSVSREQRAIIEDDLKAGRLPAVVATSSLELGIDMGVVDLVVQVESPPSVAGGLQRVGRAGHQVGAISRGVVLPKFRGDLVQAAVVAQRMVTGQIEAIRIPRNPLDVLAQQIVAMVALDEWRVDDLLALLRSTAPFATLTPAVLEAVLDMAAGLYPGDEFAELKPRLGWDRENGVLRGRPGAQRLAVTSGGTIPDRGLFGVFLVGERVSRVGELDEEMVYESRVGDVFALGASSWRIEEITHDRVVVSPAPGVPGRMPFWHGDALGRPYELGVAVGEFLRSVNADSADHVVAQQKLRDRGLDERAATNLLAYVAEQRAATGVLPDDHTIVVERFRDELGDWRVVVHSPFGATVHAPWALIIAARLRERFGLDAAVMHADDGIVLRLPDTDDDAAIAESIAELVVDADEVEAIVTAEVGASALFASRFRECAARALLLPRRRPDRRTPLWQQRQRSAQLLSVASKYASFPIVLETVREVLQDVYDVPALVELMRDIGSRTVRLVEVETTQASPFAQSLLFGYVASFLYEGDSPLAERRAQALALDTALLAELLGEAELRDLLDEKAIATIERSLSRREPEQRLRHADDLADALRVLGPLATDEIIERGGSDAWIDELSRTRRAIEVGVGGTFRWAAVEDAARLRDALGVALPPGLPDAFLEPVADPLGDLIARFARTRGPFTAQQAADELGIGVAVARAVLERLGAEGRVVAGEFRPGGTGAEWCDSAVLRRIRRASVAALRKEVEPVAPVALARFLPAWQNVGSRRTGVDGLYAVIDQLAGAALPASALETLVLPSRVSDYSPAMLDELTSSGEVVWWGVGALPGGDGVISLAPAASIGVLGPEPEGSDDPVTAALVAAVEGGGGWFFRDLCDRVGRDVGIVDDAVMVTALWNAVWAGWVTNDTLAPLRSMVSTSGRRVAVPSRRPRMPSRSGPPAASGRWSALVTRELDPTRRAAARVSALLERHGVLTRGAVMAERVPGGFAAAYRVLSAFEDSGRARRAYVVEGLGAAQFALPGAIDRLRAMSRDEPTGASVVLAALDPANPYGAALPWPDRSVNDESGLSVSEASHRPGRKAGAIVVLVDGALVLFLERGGKSLLTFTDDVAILREGAEALVAQGRAGHLGKLALERIDGETAVRSWLAPLLQAAGLSATPGALRLRI